MILVYMELNFKHSEKKLNFNLPKKTDYGFFHCRHHTYIICDFV